MSKKITNQLYWYLYGTWEAVKQLSFVWSIAIVFVHSLAYRDAALTLPLFVISVLIIMGGHWMRSEQLTKQGNLYLFFGIASIVFSGISILRNRVQYTAMDALLLILAIIIVELLFNLVAHIRTEIALQRYKNGKRIT